MNYYGPRELKKPTIDKAEGRLARLRRRVKGAAVDEAPGLGLWHYTCQNDRRVWPLGYCAQDCQGHSTPREACEHMTEFLLDEADYTYKGTTSETCEAEGCSNSTYGGVTYNLGGPGTVHLCSEHRIRKHVKEVIGVVGKVYSSW